MNNHKPSFFERLTGSMRLTEQEFESSLAKNKNRTSVQDFYNDDDEDNEESLEPINQQTTVPTKRTIPLYTEPNNDPEVAELSVDVYYDRNTIYLQTMTAGVSKSDLEISISREQITIKGSRSRGHSPSVMDQYLNELYWGPFERTVDLPDEIDIERAEAHELNGLVTITLPKFDKQKKTNLKIK